jgi:hypothetical protein
MSLHRNSFEPLTSLIGLPSSQAQIVGRDAGRGGKKSLLMGRFLHRRFDKTPFLLDFQAELILRRQTEHVFGGEYLLAVAQHRVARNGLVLLRAEDQPDRRVVVLRVNRPSYIRT